MGCDKVCQAKKKAEKAKRQAADAQRAAERAKNQRPSTPGVPRVTGVSVEVITVGHVLGVHEKKGALSPWEVATTVGGAGRNALVAGSAARGLIAPVSAAFGVFTGMIVAQKVGRIAKPIVKLAVNIGGIVFNFANIGELLADIALLLVTIFVGLAPIFLALLKNIFFSIPVDVGILTTTQLDQLKDLVSFAKIEIKNALQQVVTDISAFNIINKLNEKEQTKSDLGGNISPPNLLDYSGLSDALSNAIQNTPVPFDLDGLLQTLDGNTDGLPTSVDELLEDYAFDFERGMKAAQEQILENLTEKLKSQTINILEIDGVSNFDQQNKNKAKTVAESLNDASKRIELLQAGEILQRQFTVSGQQPTEEGQVFDDNDLAVTAAENMLSILEQQISVASAEKTNSGLNRKIDANEPFLTIFNNEIEKKKGQTVEVREDLAAIELASDIIEAQKNPFVSSMMDKVNTINLDLSSISDIVISLDPRYEASVSNQFTDLKTNIFNSQKTIIENHTVNTTNDMINLKDLILNNSQQMINDAVITVDQDCLDDFGKSVCDSINNFKSKLFAEVKVAIQEGDLAIETLDVPDGISKLELKKMLDLLLNEIKKKLIQQTRDIIVEEVVPCKACKPCEDMIADMNIYASKSINKSKDNIHKHIQGQITNNTSLDWTITDTQSITDKKNQLISNLNMALLRNSGELQLIDDMLFRLKAEEKELIKNIRLSLQAVAQ